jgi:hypothetical protein
MLQLSVVSGVTLSGVSVPNLPDLKGTDLTSRMNTPEKPPSKMPIFSSSASLLLAAVEAICVFVISANGIAAVVGSTGIVLAEGARIFHQAAIRLPLLAVATLIAVFNLWMLLNTWHLRRAPAARWRIRPLQPSQRRRIGAIAILSVVTLLLVAAELFFHHKLHGSAFASVPHTSSHFQVPS